MSLDLYSSINEVIAGLSAKLDSKEAFDAVLLRVDRYNGGRIGYSERKERTSPDEPMVLTREKSLYQPIGSLCGTHVGATGGYGLPRFYTLNNKGQRQATERLEPSMWWLVREWVRMYTGAYGLIPEALMRINLSLPWACAIPDPDNLDNGVKYTIDPAGGEADRKVTTTLGRLLRKVFPDIADEQIRNCEAAYRSEMSSVLELVEKEGFIEAYMIGPSSCMVKSKTAWGDYVKDSNGTAHHPLEVYLRDEFKLAVQRNSDNGISARGIVWHNPDDEEDRRFVRVYGDSALTNKLLRKGYRHAGFAGAKLNKIAVAMKDHYLMAYIDSGPVDICHGVVHDGDDLRLISKSEAGDFRAAGVAPPSAQMTGGSVVLPEEINVKVLTFTCPITGDTFSRVTRKPALLMKQGKVIEVSPQVIDLQKMTIACRIDDNGMFADAFVYKDDVTNPTFMHEDTLYLRDRKTMSRLGFVELAERFYGPDKFVKRSSTSVVIAGFSRDTSPSEENDEETRFIDINDAVDIIRTRNDGTPYLEVTHKMEINSTHTPVQRLKAKRPAYAAPGVVVVKTTTNRKVVVGVHEVVRLFDGRLAARSASTCVRLFGTYYWSLDGELGKVYKHSLHSLHVARTTAGADTKMLADKVRMDLGPKVAKDISIAARHEYAQIYTAANLAGTIRQHFNFYHTLKLESGKFVQHDFDNISMLDVARQRQALDWQKMVEAARALLARIRAGEDLDTAVQYQDDRGNTYDRTLGSLLHTSEIILIAEELRLAALNTRWPVPPVVAEPTPVPVLEFALVPEPAPAPAEEVEEGRFVVSF